MPLPEQVFFRHENGSAVGPFAMTALEVLYDARIVDERTPISADGHGFRVLSQWPDVLAHVMTIKDALTRGEDPWPDVLPGVDYVIADGVRVPQNLIGALIAHAGANATGALSVESEDGRVNVAIKDGKVVALSTTVPDLVLSEYLFDEGLVDETALATAEANAPQVGGDLGAALVSQALIEPHVYFEALINWAKWVLGRAASEAYGPPTFEAVDVPSPSVPLGFDRLGLPIEIVRDAFPIAAIREMLLPKKRCPIIPSQVEGVRVEDCKLQPKELRVLNRVNGVLALKDLLGELGGSEEKDQALLRAIFFAEQAGFIVFGEDDSGRRERAEAASLEEQYKRLLEKTDFELLGIDEKSSDEEVRVQYKKIAKVYHPDTTLPTEADPALIAARHKVFTLITDAFTRQEKEADRYRYALELEQSGGIVRNDPVKVQNTLQAETEFKKSEVLVNLRKFDEAISHLNEAIRLSPDDVEFKIQQQYVLYLVAERSGNGDEAADEAIRRVLKLMNQNANVARGYLVLGYLYKAVEKLDLAHKYFEKVLEYDEDNPQAMREVRYGNLRKEREKKKKKRWL